MHRLVVPYLIVDDLLHVHLHVQKARTLVTLGLLVLCVSDSMDGPVCSKSDNC